MTIISYTASSEAPSSVLETSKISHDLLCIYEQLKSSQWGCNNFPKDLFNYHSLLNGERYVEALRVLLASRGVYGYLVDQYLPYASQVAYWNNLPPQSDPVGWRSHPQSTLSSGLGNDICKKFQRDLRILLNLRNGQKKGLNIEVKSRSTVASGSIWQYPNIDVGSCKHWDLIKFPVHYLAVIDTSTGDTRICPADTMTRETSWLRRKNHDICYSVPRHLFTSIEAWVDFLRDKYQ